MTTRVGLAAVLLVLLGAAALLHAQTAPARAARPSLFSITVAGQPTLTDTVKSVLIEHDRPQSWNLLVTGAKGKGQYTCEVRSADKGLLFGLQRAITDNDDVVVSCANASRSPRGGALVDLDSEGGGSLVVTVNR